MREWKKKSLIVSFVFVEVILFFLFFSFLTGEVFAGFGEHNVTVQTNLTVGNVFPEILNVTLNGGSNIILTPNDSVKVSCLAHLVDYNGDSDIAGVNATLFDNFSSTINAADDNNTHYTNSSCVVDTGVGDEYTARVNCTFDVWYYANATEWNCTIQATDSYNWVNINYTLGTVSPLLALGLPDIINYGTVNATYVSNENVTNVTNLGNVKLNLSLSGYAWEENDGSAMNCTLGANKNISIEYEKYNLTTANSDDLDYAQFIENYTNLSSIPTTKIFNLDFRHQEAVNEAWNHSYWRIYVPLGVAGTCRGNIIFGAVQAPGT